MEGNFCREPDTEDRRSTRAVSFAIATNAARFSSFPLRETSSGGPGCQGHYSQCQTRYSLAIHGQVRQRRARGGAGSQVSRDVGKVSVHIAARIHVSSSSCCSNTGNCQMNRWSMSSRSSMLRSTICPRRCDVRKRALESLLRRPGGTSKGLRRALIESPPR